MKQLALVTLTVIAFLAFSYRSPYFATVEAGGLSQNPERGLANYDIRSDPSVEATAKVAGMRGAIRNDIRTDLGGANSRFKIDYNAVLDVAEVIAANQLGAPLTPAAGKRSRADILLDFVRANDNVFRINSQKQLHKTADYTNPDGNLSFVIFEQRIADIPVFGAELKGGFTKQNELFRVINSLAPGVDPAIVNNDFGTADAAVVSAAARIGTSIARTDLTRQDWSRSDKVEFTAAAFTDKILAERFYFPVGNGVLRPSWRVLLWTKGPAYYVVVDADGTLLWRKNISEDQVDSATYSVYGNLTSLMKTADSPSPFSPGCLAPTGCAQPPAIARMNFTLIGNESPYTFNNLGWIPDTGLPVRTPANPNITDGNNVEAGIDRNGTQGVDDNGWAVGNPARVFSYTYNPAPGNPPPGEEPLPPGPQTYPPSQFQQGVVTHGFYMINRWHDEMYRFGFTEQAGNFQHFNFGRGGSEADRISYEIQDSSGTNSANFSLPADGLRPRLQMFIWTGGTPDRDGALDSQMVTHEMTHGLSGRLIGNSTGLGSNMARGMGEGWSDFYAFALLSEPSDDPLGTHALAAYVSYLVTPTYDSNYYYGLRRFPVAVWASRGPNGLPHNPLTFKYINAGCDTFIGTTVSNPNSAYPRNPVFSTSGGTQPCDQIHNLGEVWAAALWEVRDQLIQRHGTVEGNRRALQYVTDGMKLSPLNPTMLQARDAIIAAATISTSTDHPPVWRGFVIRGLGSGASIQNAGTGSNNTVVTESFEIPTINRRPARADFDGDRRSDVSVFRPSDGIWYLNRSTAGFTAVRWGLANDKPLAEDFDGDGRSDIVIFRATEDGAQPDYYILQSSSSTIRYLSWGLPDDIPFADDFDDNSSNDAVVFRPSTRKFLVRRSGDGSLLVSPAMPAGTPLVGDFDGDGNGDFATFDNGTWHLSRSERAYATDTVVNWGTTGDHAVPADYDGDGKDDIAVFRPSDGIWYIANSTGGNRFVNFGLSTDTPVPGDYDGDGRADIAVYRNGVWYIDRSTGGIVIFSFGLSGDVPLPATFIP
ncbi:MAG: M36 family metallopeptidase [Acidobacteriota bacterium]